MFDQIGPGIIVAHGLSLVLDVRRETLAALQLVDPPALTDGVQVADEGAVEREAFARLQVNDLQGIVEQVPGVIGRALVFAYVGFDLRVVEPVDLFDDRVVSFHQSGHESLIGMRLLDFVFQSFAGLGLMCLQTNVIIVPLLVSQLPAFFCILEWAKTFRFSPS